MNCLLADLAPADSPLLLWLIVGGALALGPALNAWINVVQAAKGKTADTSKLATRAELADVEARIETKMEKAMKGIGSDVSKLTEDVAGLRKELADALGGVNDSITALHRSLGRAEGLIEAAPAEPPARRRRRSGK